MDVRGSRYVSCGGYVDCPMVRMTSPTCKDLGIPTDTGEEGRGGGGGGGVYPLIPPRVIHNPSLHLDGLRYEAETHTLADPYSPLCMIPLPGALALHAATEPSFIRKRNERERDRVRCVNEGYERLKEHLPSASRDKRISKVDTLRGAIDYIRQLQTLLDQSPLSQDGKRGHSNDHEQTGPHATSFTKNPEESRSRNEDERPRKRRGSLSSEQSPLSDGILSESEDEHLLKRRRIQ